MVRVPTPSEEDAKRPHREREHLVRERLRIENRIEALLFAQGIGGRPSLRSWERDIAEPRTRDGRALPPLLRTELDRLRRRLVVVLENRPRETKIISDLLAGAIYTATTLAVVNFVFGVAIVGLVATSGVLAIILGLALQSTLSDVFSGIAVGLERAYKPGDLIWVEGGIEGQVLQVNWRSTQIATLNDSIAIVPNSVIAKSRLAEQSISAVKRSNSCQWARSASGIAVGTGGVAEGETRARPMTEMTIAEGLVTVDNWLRVLLLLSIDL